MVNPAAPYHWDDPDTARYYEAFCQRHGRYDDANRALLTHAHLASGQRILDMAAGTGRTAEGALALIGRGRIDCVEPAHAMRAAGQARLTDPRITWLDALPESTEAAESYDRILCGAAIWQITPLNGLFRQLQGLLAPGGALVFNIPALYLGLADPPGGGGDPMLLALPAAIVEIHTPHIGLTDQAPAEETLPLTPDDIDQWLSQADLVSERWSIDCRLSQAAYRDWLKIPVISNQLFPGVPADKRADYIDCAYDSVDKASWRWEVWYGWTAWRRKG